MTLKEAYDFGVRLALERALEHPSEHTQEKRAGISSSIASALKKSLPVAVPTLSGAATGAALGAPIGALTSGDPLQGALMGLGIGAGTGLGGSVAALIRNKSLLSSIPRTRATQLEAVQKFHDLLSGKRLTEVKRLLRKRDEIVDRLMAQSQKTLDQARNAEILKKTIPYIAPYAAGGSLLGATAGGVTANQLTSD